MVVSALEILALFMFDNPLVILLRVAAGRLLSSALPDLMISFPAIMHLPPLGLLYLGKIKHAFIKLILFVMIFICKGLRSAFVLLFALLFFLLQIVDLFTIALGSMRDGNGIPLL